MKIVYLIEDFSVKGGAERVISNKANYMSACFGYDVTIVSIMVDSRPQSYPLDNRVKLISLNVPFAVKDKGPAVKMLSRINTLIKASTRFNRLMNKIQPDIIFFTMSLGALILPLYTGKARKIYESHLARRFTPYHQMFLPMELMADAVVCLTTGDAAEYRRARNMEIIPNFIENPTHYVSDYSVKRAMAVGRLEYAKGFDILIDCWKSVKSRHPEWSLDIFGEGSLHSELQKQIDQLGLTGKITLRGKVDDINNEYAFHSLHLMSSRYEGLPMTLIEAQACGLPSVAFDFNYGARDIINDGVSGILVKQGDTEAFINAMNRMMSSEKLREDYGKAAKSVILKFSRDEIMRQWKSLLTSPLPSDNHDIF